MFQAIFIFSDWILIKQIVALSTLFVLGGGQIFKNFYMEFSVGDWGMSKNA